LNTTYLNNVAACCDGSRICPIHAIAAKRGRLL
jgi:hypothetical protein